MTTCLRSCGEQLSVSLIRQACQPIDDELADYMGISVRVSPFVRTVILSCDQQPCMLADVVIPRNVYKRHQDWLDNLGEQPIGDRLFARPGLQRHQILIAQLPVGSEYHHRLRQQGIKIAVPMWARRSLLQDETICVCVIEVCLPDLLLRLGCQ